jgi:hypothetical protein
MRYVITVGMICAALLMSLSGCQHKPKPCDCSIAEAELHRYTLSYLDTLEDNGNLRQQLKACNEND